MRFLRFPVVLLLLLAVFGPAIASPPVLHDQTEESIALTLVDLRARQEGVRLALRVFDDTFQLPANTRPVSLTLQDLPGSAQGGFLPLFSLIAVSNQSEYPAFAALHELGHFFDLEVLAPALCPPTVSQPTAGLAPMPVSPLSAPLPDPYASVALQDPTHPHHADLKPWIAAVLQSDTGRALSTLLRMKAVTADEGARSHLQYLTTPEEWWARSFAQYVATRSGDATLLAQMEIASAKDYPLNGGWSREAFVPIAKTMDDLFHKNGWLKKKTDVKEIK